MSTKKRTKRVPPKPAAVPKFEGHDASKPILPGHVVSKIVLRKVDELERYAGNARRHPPEQIAAIAESIRRFGFVLPVVIDAAGQIVGGHGTLEAAKSLGFAKVPTVTVEHLEGKDVRALRRALNKLPELSVWDDELLAVDLAEDGAEIDLTGTGFTDEDVTALLESLEPPNPPSAASSGPDVGNDVDELDEPSRPRAYESAKRVSKTGDLWHLGPHRLLVGDARERKDVARLLGGAPARLVFSSPPASALAERDNARNGRARGDGLSPRGYQALVREVLQAARPQACYLLVDWRTLPTLLELVEAAGLTARALLVWKKSSPARATFWRPQHEFVLAGSAAAPRRRAGQTAPGNVIDCPRVVNEWHPHETPVRLIRDVLRGDEVTERGKCEVVDLFAGSGSTILAAHAEERVCRALEVDPVFADCAIARWQATSGELARLDGKATWEETGARRARS